MFKHYNLNLPELEAELVEGVGRLYTTPSGIKYPSVTTVIGATSDNSWLEEWKLRVGEEEVRKVSAMAARRGTAVHELAELYLKNDPNYTKGHMPANIASFKCIKPFLDKHITAIAGLEVPLWSDKLRVAGRVDCIAKWDGIWSIVDFKTSKREKKRNDIHSYFMQESAYSYMLFERTGMLCKQLVTVMTIDDSQPKLFVERAKDWLPKFIELREKVNF